MSRDHLQRFSEAYKADSSLREALGGLGKRPEAWRQRARELGFDLTPEEIKGLITGAEELSDDDLEEVAGGWDGPPPGGD